ncbi:MAG: cyclic-di-AMP receptor [Clostridia bacterium]|nr:cyclic-di-AMP receptor [Clostridia bacterium]MBR3974498.1 cyclic-di-AMP receptor [Clostridia bacterium]
MKLIVAIVNNDDSNVVASALTKENFMVTKLSTTGGFLMVGNTTFLIGTEDDKVERVKEVIRKHSMVRTHQSKTTESFGQGFSEGALGSEVTVGGATVFVLSVDSMSKY